MVSRGVLNGKAISSVLARLMVFIIDRFVSLRVETSLRRKTCRVFVSDEEVSFLTKDYSAICIKLFIRRRVSIDRVSCDPDKAMAVYLSHLDCYGYFLSKLHADSRHCSKDGKKIHYDGFSDYHGASPSDSRFVSRSNSIQPTGVIS